MKDARPAGDLEFRRLELEITPGLAAINVSPIAYANNQSDQLLCRNFKSLLEEYNKACGKQLGVLQVPDCK